MIEMLMVICVITSVSPYYDCDEKWVIVLEDSLIVPSVYDEPVTGYAIDATLIESYPISLTYPTIKNMDNLEWLVVGNTKRDACFDGICFPVLWHEMKHLMCDCDWHENMVPYLPSRNF